jgi:HD-like signal output (HDOD) protein
MEERAEHTLQRVREALEKGEVAGVPEVIRLIQELSAKAFSITIKELADIIARDVAVTAKVISAANTVGYNPWAIPISTVSQAIQVIGFERVRNLAISLLLAENAERTRSEEQRETAALALQSGFMAQEIAAGNKNAGLNPEQAFICASLRNYGKLIMTTFLLEDFRAARDLEDSMEADEAFRSIFGLTPLELGYHLLLSRNLPEAILNSLQEFPRERVDKATARKESYAYLAIADLSVRLSEVAADPRLSPELFEEKANALLGHYQQWSQDRDLKLGDLFRKTEEHMRSLRRHHGLHSLSGPVLDALQRRLEGQPLAARVSAKTARQTPGEALLAAVTSAPFGPSEPSVPEPASSPVLDAISTITRSMETQSMSFSKALSLLLQTVHDQLGATDSILFLHDRRASRLAPRLGLGPIFDAIKASETVDPRQRDVFGISFSRQEDVFVENADDPKIARYLPSWLKSRASLRSFLILPLHDAGGTYGMLWSGRTRDKISTVTPRVLKQLRALRTHVATVKALEAAKRQAMPGASA